MKAAIFDLDGTLADTIADLGDAVNCGLEKLGCPVYTTEEYKKMVGNGAKLLCRRALPEERRDEYMALHGLFREYYGAHYLDKTRLYPGIREALGELAAMGVKLAVATNKPEDFARDIIAELLPEFDFVRILGGNSRRLPKPDTEIIAEILAELPDEDCEVYMIGDSNVDVETGKNACIPVIGCLWGFRGRAELETAGADFIADAPQDIVKIICG